MLKDFVLSKKTAGYFDPYHPFGCLIVFAAERTVHTLAVFILVDENPRKFLLPALIKSTLSMFMHISIVSPTPPPGDLMGQCWEICQPILAPRVRECGVFAQAASAGITEVKLQYMVEAEQVCNMAALKSCHSTKLVGEKSLGGRPHV